MLQNCLAKFLFVAMAVVPLQLMNGQAKTPFTPQQLEFFENRIRPLLVEHCLECHGADENKIRGGLWLTSREDLLVGGDSGPAIVPGRPEESLLIHSIQYDDFEMPPAGQLSNQQIKDVIEWVKMGAPDPRIRNQRNSPSVMTVEEGRNFWAFRPRVNQLPQISKESDWPITTIDQYILEKLQANQLSPNPDASRETLVRRIHIALTGLPPTPDQIDEFINDPTSLDESIDKLIGKLLDSHHFGERWGRHWLDVVRFAESSGGGRSLMFEDAWRFRDYVIDSFNTDKPFDQMIREQIAGDLLPFETREQQIEQITATGMLALGPTNYEQQDKELLRMEVVDEQVDTVGKAFMGMTLGCARCHDHKFDPIPMADYYAMAGIFKSTVSLVDGNVSRYVERELATQEELERIARHQANVELLSNKLAKIARQLKDLGIQNPASNPGKASIVKTVASKSLAGIVIDNAAAETRGEWIESQSLRPFVDRGYIHDDATEKGKKSVVYTPNFENGGRYEVRMSYSHSGNRASNTKVIIDHQDGIATRIVNQSQRPEIDGLFHSLGKFRFEANNRSTVTISNENADGHVIADAIQFIPLDENDNLIGPTYKQPTQSELKENTVRREAKVDEEIHRLQKQYEQVNQHLKKLKRKPPRPSVRVMSVKESPQPADGHIHIRGSVRNLGEVVQRGFISVCCAEDDDAKPALGTNESGRLQLANWLADADHPLTARVYVNRVWRHLFGAGLVPTLDNFGIVGQPPTHPELLDYLANEFVKNGWSTKKLIRKIMLSRVYRLSAKHDDLALQTDPENRLHWRANRRRVDAEVLRDSLLYIAGQLDTTQGGLTIRKISQYDLGYRFETNRRSVYVPAFRNSMLDFFEVFDFANPNLVVGDRNTSTLPTQALFLMNHPKVIKLAEHTAKNLIARQSLSPTEKIELAYRQSVGRRPQASELESVLSYLQSLQGEGGFSELEAWTSFCQSLFASLEFRYVE